MYDYESAILKPMMFHESQSNRVIMVYPNNDVLRDEFSKMIQDPEVKKFSISKRVIDNGSEELIFITKDSIERLRGMMIKGYKIFGESYVGRN